MKNILDNTQASKLFNKIYYCGEMAKNAFLNDAQGKVLTKLNASDQVTQTEFFIEECLIDLFKAILPNFTIIGEETGTHESMLETSTGQVFIDPIDGTSNYLHGIPYFSVSVLLRRNDGEELGLVYDPIQNKLFSNTIKYSNSPANQLIGHAKERVQDMTIAFISGYGADLALSELVTNTLWRSGVKRVMANWSPSLDYCRLSQGYIDAVVYCPEFVQVDDIAGRAIATSEGMLQSITHISYHEVDYPIHIDYMTSLPADFIEALGT